VQVDVKHVKVTSGRLYQFTAIDEATRFPVLKAYDHNSIRSVIDFVEELRRKLPVAIRRIQTDWGSEFGSHFTLNHHLIAQPRAPGRIISPAWAANSSSRRPGRAGYPGV
jgi:hypothetical protein